MGDHLINVFRPLPEIDPNQSFFICKKQGLLKTEDLKERPQLPNHKVDFGSVISWKSRVLDLHIYALRKKKNQK